ncbi:MAG TPA: outer membrane beta-barrel protein [Niastella sp.]
MHHQPKTILLLFAVLATLNTFANDTTRRKPLFFSISAGLTSSKVYGSMVERNEQFDKTVTQENGSGFALNFHLKKMIGDFFYFKTGLNYLLKQVDPQQNSGVVYKDHLKTHYLSLPILFGLNFLPAESKFNASIELGPSADFKLIDKTYIAPDRKSVKVNFASLALNPGATISYAAGPKVNLQLQYSYLHSITNTFVTHLYWGSTTEPIKKFEYRYNTQMVTFGIQWRNK